MIWWWIGGVVTALVAVEALTRLPFIRMAAGYFEEIPQFRVDAAEPNEEAERVEFPTTDGLLLRGSRLRHRAVGPPTGVCLFAPELGGTHWMAAQYAEAVLDAGYDLVGFDFRNQGESDALPEYKPMHWLTQHEIDDLTAAVDFVRSCEEYRDLPLVLFGVSRGGGTALAVASRRKDVDRVWVDSGFSTNGMLWHFAKRWAPLVAPAWLLRILPGWHVRQTLTIVRWYSGLRTGRPYRTLERMLPRLRRTPVQLVSGERDSYVPPAIAADLARRIGSTADVWVVRKAKHNAARKVVESEYDERLGRFVGDRPDSDESEEEEEGAAETAASLAQE